MYKSAGAYRSQKLRALKSLELELQMVISLPTQVLGAELGSLQDITPGPYVPFKVASLNQPVSSLFIGIVFSGYSLVCQNQPGRE